MRRDEIKSIKKYFRLANYITVAQIYLQNNFLLEKPLSPDDIKPRLLGHWGTCPGINFTYAHLNFLIKKTGANILFILGPGHGFPALQANLYLEGTLRKFYPQAKFDESGLSYISKNFSWPYGFPSHTNPGTPGSILEGGELGYSLSTAFGAVLDNPNLIAACLIGDGEAETGPLAASWHLNKFLSPSIDGAVLPILHLNEYKISGPTIYGRMSRRELKNYFCGCGWQPIFVKGNSLFGDIKMNIALQKCYSIIRDIQGGKDKKWPMIILETPKGWTGIKEFNGKKIEGNYLSHQVPLKNVKDDKEERRALEDWLLSYGAKSLFSNDKGPIRDVLSILPEENKRMGRNIHTMAEKVSKNLELPDWTKFAEPPKNMGEIGSSNMRRIGDYLAEVFSLNKGEANFRLFSPDETYSNKLDAVFKKTKRIFLWPLKKTDEDFSSRRGGVIEILSEHSLQGILQGYVLTGRHGVFASYEAFIEIVSSMADQLAKFLKASREFPWRKGVPSFNYILTSSGWRQDHNGFSHQNPSFIDGLLQSGNDFVSAYFPVDGTMSLAVIDYCLRTRDKINIISAGKTLEPKWLGINQAKDMMEKGIDIWNDISDKNPDIVFVGIGDYMTKECIYAIDLIKKEIPKVKVRFVNILEINSFGFGNYNWRKNNPDKDFNFYFTSNKPVIFNFHGYPETIKDILFDKSKNPSRFKVFGYIENGSTTTPFDMQIRNKTSRWHLLMEAVLSLEEKKKISSATAKKIIDKHNEKISKHNSYIKKHGVDLPEIQDFGKSGISEEIL